MNIEKLKINFKNELNILKDYFEHKEFIISLFISKYRQINNNEYRIFLIKEIIDDENLLPYSQRFFFLIFSVFKLKPNKDIYKEENKSKLIFYESSKEETILFIDKIISEENKKSKILIEILLYYFQSHIKIPEDDIDEYSEILKNINEVIDKNEIEEIKYINYPYITRIFASAFLKVFLEEYIKAVVENKQITFLKNVTNSFQNRKLLSSYIQNIIAKILYYNVLNQDLNQFKIESKKNNLRVFLENYIEEENDNNIIEKLQKNNQDENFQYYSLNCVINLIDFSKIKEYLKNNKTKYPVISK